MKRYILVLALFAGLGFVYGGSGTMYFTGDFDGHQFVCDTKPEVVKWLVEPACIGKNLFPVYHAGT